MRLLSRFVASGVSLASVTAQSLYDYGGEASALAHIQSFFGENGQAWE